MPCGSCGRSDNPLCAEITITISGTTTRAESQCPLFRKISYANAKRGTIATPCRNVPVRCPICSRDSSKPRSRVYHGFWRYNMATHFRTHHREYASPGNSNNGGHLALSAEAWDAMEILPKEYESYGIHASLIPRYVLDSTSFSSIPPSTPSGGKRSRAFTNTTTNRPPTKQPRHH